MLIKKAIISLLLIILMPIGSIAYDAPYTGAQVDASISYAQNLVTLSGAAGDATHLSVFTGTTIPDNQTIKAALQALETALELKIGSAGVTYEALNANSDVGTGATQVAAGNHNHSGVYEPAGVTESDISDLGTSVQMQASMSTDVPANETDPNALLTAGTDNVKDIHIDWGGGAGQVGYPDIVALWASGSCSGYLKSDGSCDTPSGGSAIVFDIGDDSGNDSTDVNEIATSGDTNAIFSEPSADKILIDLTKNWPAADSAATLSGDLDPDQLSGDTTDDNLVDQDIIEGMAITGVASPGFTAYDSDSPGADKTAGFIGWQYVDGADGSENTDWLLQIMQGGVLTTILAFDESDDQFETTKPINSSGGFVGALTGNASTATAAASQVITDNAIATVDQVGGAAASDFAKFTANGLEGRSYAETRQDLGIDTAANLEASLSLGAYASDILGAADAAALTALLSAASDTVSGRVELATIAETTTGTDTGRGVTPDGLSGSVYGQKEIGWKIYDSDTATAVADGLQAAVISASMNGMNLIDVTCSIADQNSASGGATTVVLRRVRAGTPQDMTSTGVTIAYNEYTASDETVNATYDDVATGDSIYVDVNAVTTGAAQLGLSCTAVFQTP